MSDHTIIKKKTLLFIIFLNTFILASPGTVPAFPKALKNLPDEISDVLKMNFMSQVADRAMRSQRWEDAISAYRVALQFEPQNAKFRQGLSCAALKNGQHDLAQYTLLQLEEAENRFPLLLAEIRAAKGDQRAALKYLEKAFASGQLCHQDWTDGKFSILENEDPFKRLRASCDRVYEIWQEVEPNGAGLEMAQELAFLTPKDPRAWARLGYIAVGMGKLEIAEEAFKAQFEINDQEPSTSYNLACTYARQGKVKLALTWLDKAVKLGWTDVEHTVKDQDLTNLRKEVAYQELIHEMTLVEDIKLDIRRSLKRQDSTQVYSILQKIDLDRQSSKHKRQLLDALASADYFSKKYDAAATRMKQLIPHTASPDLGRLLYNISCCLSLQNKTNQALDYLELAIEMGFTKPKKIRSDRDLDNLHQTDRFERALNRAHEKNLLDRGDVETWTQLNAVFDNRLSSMREHEVNEMAWEFYYAKMWELSGKMFIELFKRNPQENHAYNAACCLAQQGKTQEALVWLNKAVENGFSDSDHLMRDEDLAQLRSSKEFKKLVLSL